MPTNWDKVYQNAGMGKPPKRNAGTSKKTTGTGANPKEKTGSTNWAKVYREAGMKMQAPELEELGAVPDFTVDNSWQGSMDLGNVDVNAGYGEFERQRGQLDTLQRYQEAAARNAQKAADYFDYARDEASAQSFQRALELYQQATDRYNSAVGTYNTGVENFQKNPEVAKQQRQIAAVQRAQNKSYAELEQMITETADQMDQVTDENARAQLQEQMDIYKAVQGQTEMTAADAAKRQGELEREIAQLPEARAQFVQTPAGWVKVDANGNQAEYEENERRRSALERELRRMQGEEYTKTYEAEIDTMPEGMRESIIAAGQAREQAAGAVKADALNMGRNGPELAAVAAQNNQTVATMTAALRGMGYDDATIDGMLTWGAQQANAERMDATVENERAKAETRADRSGNYVKGDLLNLGEAVGSGLLGGAGYVNLLMQEASRMGKTDPLTGKKVPLDFSTDAMLPAAVQNAVNEAENSAIAKAMGERYGVDENGNLNAEAQRKANIRMNAFQIAESMGESAATMLVGMAAGGTGGLAEKFGNAASTLILASGAATQTAIDMHEQGFDDSTALIMGGIAGAAEYVTEKVSLESLEEIFGARSLEGLTKMGKARTFIGNILKQGITEGSEEVASELINTVADYMLMGDWNQMERRTQEIVAEKQEQGIAVTEDAAKRQAIREMLSGVANSFISGAISGGLMGAAGSAVNTVSRNVSDIQTGRSITKSGNTEQVTQLINAMDAETQKRLGLNKYNPESSRQVGRAARITVQQQMENAVRGRLAELGVDNPSDVLVAAVMDSAENGVQLNKAEKAAIAGDGKALQVVEEMKSMGQYGGKSAAQLALEGFRNGTLNESNAWVIQALAEQEETERKLTKTEQAFADRQAEGQTAAEREQPADEGKSYSKRASEIYADEEQRKAFERLYGPLEGSATENRALIARTLRAIDMEQYSAEETAGAVQNNAGNEQESSENVTEEETVERVRFGEEYHVRELMKDMTHAKANEIQRSPELKAAWESITGEKFSGNRKEAHDQLMNWTESEKTDIRDASERAYNETEDQITELAESGRLEIPSDNGTMELHLQESRRGGAVAAVTREGQPPVLFEGDTIEDAARQAVEYAKGEQNGGQGTRAGGERAVGLDSQRSAEGLAGEAGSDQSGTEQSRRIEKINALGLQQSSAAEQGVANGTDTVKNRFFRPGDSEAVDKLIREDAQYAAVAALCKARGQNLILFTGLLEVNEGGKVILADGMQQGSDIYIRADGNEHTPLKIYEHEDTHDAIEAAGGEDGALYQSMKEKLIRNLGGEAQFEELKAKYAEALPDGYSEYDIVQEMLSDARGTMNDFKGNTQLKAELDEEVRQKVGERRTGTRGSGNRRSYVGQLSKTADTNMLSRAEQMEQQNIDAETIRQETGWFRGADGEWRYEIDDSRARVNLKGDARFRQEHPGYARYMELMDTMLYGELTSDEFKELRELDREWSDVSKKLSASVRDGEARLGDVMEHDGLYEAYPDIAEIGVTFEKMEAGNRGAYIPSQNRIVLNEELKNDPDALMNSLLHEVQHVIQQKEGFAGGASPEYWNREETYNRAMQKWQDEHGKIFYHLSAEDKALYREYREISAREDALLENPTLEAMEEMDALEERSDELYRELYGKEWFGKLNRLDRLMSDMEQAVKSMYWSTAGEIEARDSANRRSMTAEERKNSPPDTGDELTVFADGAGKAAWVNPDFEKELDEWIKKKTADQRLVDGGYFTIGTTSDVLSGIGVNQGKIDLRKSKAQTIMEEHPEITEQELKNIPWILENPVLVMKSMTRGDSLVLINELKAKDGRTQYVALDLTPKRGGVLVNDMSLVTSTYGKSDSGIANNIFGDSQNRPEEILYISSDIKRTEAVVRPLGVQFPSGNLKLGSVGSITYNADSVNIVGKTIYELTGTNDPNAEKRASKKSQLNVDTDTETAVSAEEIVRNQNTQEPLQDTGITDNRFTEALKKIGVNNITGSLVDYAGIEVEQQTARTAAEARRYLRRVLKETKADPRTQAFAHDVARGIYTMDDLPNTMSRGIVEELADAYRFAEGVVQDSLAYKRRQINAGLDADARKLFADSDNYNPAKFGRLSKTLMNERTPARVLRSIFGEEKGSEIYEAYWRPIIENNAAAKLWKNKQREDVKTFRDSKGTIRELTEDESAYAMKVLEGLAFEEEARNAAGMDKENLDRYIANFNQLMELMPKTGYNTEADRVDDVLSGRLTRSEAAAQSTNKALFEQIMENRLATASLPELSRALQTTLDGYEAALQARQEIRENDTVDAEIIDTAARAYQQKYQDMYTAINQLLVAHGYEEIGFIKGYAPHMQPETAQNGFQRAMEAMGLTGNVSSLPASIAGQTANFKPNMRYNPHFQSRTGNSTEYDIAKGFQEYTDYMGDIIYHMDDIMRLRRAVNYFRTEYAGEGISERISQAQQMLAARTEDKIRFAEEHDLGYIPGMTDGQVADLIEKYIEDNYGETGKLTKYSEFTTWLENAANLLAGKQSLADRGLEYTGGRQMLNVANKLMTLFRQSKVAGSLSSALNQVAQLPAITTHLGAEYSARALSDIGSGEITDEWRERSAFLVGKMDEVKLRESGYEKFMKWMFTPSSFVDDTIATMAVRGEYLRQLDMGKSDYEAMRIADDYGRQVMGSRAKLEKPQAYESKRPVSQMIHMFQVEAVNSFDYIVSDLPVEIRNMAETQGKAKAATATAAAIVAYLLQAFLLNRLGEEIYGGTPIAFDLLGLTTQFFASGEGLTANEYLLEVIDNGLEDMGQERIFGTENNIGAQDFDAKAAFADAASIAGDDIPLIRNLMAAAGWGDQTLPMINVANIGKGAKQIYEGAREGDLRYMAEGAGNIAGEVAPGGGQIKKTLQGLSTVASGGAFSGAGEERQLKYGVDKTGRNWLKAGLFGRSALSQNEQYYAGKAKTLTAGQTDVWEMLVDEEGMEPETAYKAVQKYRAIGNDKGLDSVERNKRERAVIAGLPVSDSAKAEMWVDLTHGGDHTNERYQGMMRMMRMGASWADVNAAFNEYDRLYHDENLSGTGKATEFAQFADEYAAHHGMSEYMVEAMKDTFGFSSGHRAEATAYEKLTDSDISTNHAGYIYELWSGLQPDPGKTTVSDIQKLYALGAASSLSDEERYAAAGTLTDGVEYNEDGELTAYGKMLEAQRQGLSFADYTELRNEGAVDYYFKYRGAVQDNDVARDIAIGMKQLNDATPEDETAEDWQRVNVICAATDDEDYQVAAMEELMEESEYFRFLQSNAHGITPKIWAEAMEKRPRFDTNYNGSYTQAEYTALVQSMPGLDKEQQAALWQMLAHGKRNPFDAAVGREIYDDYGVWSDAKKKREAAERKAKVEG